jgi:hypothetical protein
MKNNYPEWVLKHKKTNTEVKKIKEKYYLYEVSSFWDKVKGRAQKKSGKYLGRITEEKLIDKHRPYKPKISLPEELANKVTVKELYTNKSKVRISIFLKIGCFYIFYCKFYSPAESFTFFS